MGMSGQQFGGLQNRPYTAAAAAASNSNAVQQQQAVKNAVTSLASVSLKNTVLGTGAPSNNGIAETVVAATSGTPAVQQTTSYSPTPIQRPPGGKGKGAMTKEVVNDDVAAPSTALDVTGSKEKSDVED